MNLIVRDKKSRAIGDSFTKVVAIIDCGTTLRIVTDLGVDEHTYDKRYLTQADLTIEVGVKL